MIVSIGKYQTVTEEALIRDTLDASRFPWVEISDGEEVRQALPNLNLENLLKCYLREATKDQRMMLLLEFVKDELISDYVSDECHPISLAIEGVLTDYLRCEITEERLRHKLQQKRTPPAPAPRSRKKRTVTTDSDMPF
jgi:hypothetical protein